MSTTRRRSELSRTPGAAGDGVGELEPDLDTGYSYDSYGNITSAGEWVAGDYQCYQYDYLDRLTAAWSQSSSGCHGHARRAAPGIGGPGAVSADADL